LLRKDVIELIFVLKTIIIWIHGLICWLVGLRVQKWGLKSWWCGLFVVFTEFSGITVTHFGNRILIN